MNFRLMLTRYRFLAINLMVSLLISGSLIFFVIENHQVGKDLFTATAYIESTSQPINHDFSISIPTLKLSAPIIPDVDGTNKDVYFEALEDGVAHFKGTKKPGEGGNVFIFGHSSYYKDKPGEYKEIFKYIDKINKDDLIVVWYKNNEYLYNVIETKIVSPDDVSVLKPTTSDKLTISTCYPPGSISQRFIVIAEPSNLR